jgi:hypothetical protein
MMKLDPDFIDSFGERMAFPLTVTHETLGIVRGLTRREYFASQVMIGLMATLNDLRTDYTGQKTPEFLAHQAVRIADALCKELDKKDGS